MYTCAGGGWRLSSEFFLSCNWLFTSVFEVSLLNQSQSSLMRLVLLARLLKGSPDIACIYNYSWVAMLSLHVGGFLVILTLVGPLVCRPSALTSGASSQPQDLFYALQWLYLIYRSMNRAPSIISLSILFTHLSSLWLSTQTLTWNALDKMEFSFTQWSPCLMFKSHVLWLIILLMYLFI